MSIFGDLDIASAASDPFAVDDGTYEATLTKSSVEKSNKGGKGLTFEYTIHDSEKDAMNGRKISEWKTIPNTNPDGSFEDPDTAPTFMSFIKQRLLSLGVPESEMNTVQPEELIGLEVIVTVATKTSKKDSQDYQNVTKLRLANSDETSDGSGWS